MEILRRWSARFHHAVQRTRDRSRGRQTAQLRQLVALGSRGWWRLLLDVEGGACRGLDRDGRGGIGRVSEDAAVAVRFGRAPVAVQHGEGDGVAKDAAASRCRAKVLAAPDSVHCEPVLVGEGALGKLC